MHTHTPLSPPLSQELLALARSGTSERVSLQDMLDGIKIHALATLLILLGVPNMLPGIPGTSAVTGLPLVFLAYQMVLGQSVWLPDLIAKRSVLRSDLLAVLLRIEPWLARIEQVLKPRLPALGTAQAIRLLGGLCLLLAVLIMLPIPFANVLPATAIVLIGLGLLRQDGIFILAGIALAIAAVALIIVVYWVLLKAAIFVIAGAMA